jgi:hypothetical protein
MRRVPSAYGLAIGGDLPVLGAAESPVQDLRGRVEVSRGDARAAEEPVLEPLFRQGGGPGEPLISLDRTAAGYEMRIARFASFSIASDGERISCRPEVEPAWRWQRVLAGHALPLAALLQGIEVFHAGAVVLETGAGPGAIAIVAGSRGGKSSLAVNLALGRARLLTDDALAVEARNGALVGHPGVGAASLRANEAERLRALGLYERLEVLGEDEGGARVLLKRQDVSVPLVGWYWPEWAAKGEPVAFERLAPDPRRVLASTINLVFREPERLTRHFELSAEIAASLPLIRIAVPRDVQAAELARLIEAHALELSRG